MIEPKVKIGIIGAGSMGTLFGYHLARVVRRHDARSQHRVARRDRTRRGSRSTMRRRDALRTARSAAATFWFVGAVLVRQSRRYAAARSRPFAGQLNPSTPIVSLQNGVGNEDAIKTALGGAVPVVLGITTESSLSTGPGRARSSEAGNTILGSGGAAPKRRAAWRAYSHKAVCARRSCTIFGRICGESSLPTPRSMPSAHCWIATPARFRRMPNAARLAQAIAREAATVAAGLRINLPFNDPWQYVTEVIAVGADSKSSMAFDLEMGHPTEIDHINGAVVAAGRRIGVSTPYNDAMVRLIKAKETMLGPRVAAPT